MTLTKECFNASRANLNIFLARRKKNNLIEGLVTVQGLQLGTQYFKDHFKNLDNVVRET